MRASRSLKTRRCIRMNRRFFCKLLPVSIGSLSLLGNAKPTPKPKLGLLVDCDSNNYHISRICTVWFNGEKQTRVFSAFMPNDGSDGWITRGVTHPDTGKDWWSVLCDFEKYPQYFDVSGIVAERVRGKVLIEYEAEELRRKWPNVPVVYCEDND
jgi:hypothetical protein